MLSQEKKNNSKIKNAAKVNVDFNPAASKTNPTETNGGGEKSSLPDFFIQPSAQKWERKYFY